MATRIRWTDAEREDVIKHAVDVYIKNDTSHLEALHLGQNLALPTYRRRTLATHSAAKDEIRLLKDAYNAYISTLQKRKDVVAPTAEVLRSPESSGAQPAAADAMSMDALIAEIAKRIAASLTTAIEREVKELEHSFKLQKHDPTYKSEHISKKRIVIIGLLNDQVHSIQSEFGDKYAIKCIDTDRASGMNPPDADAYLLMKNFINHPLYHKYRGFPNHVLIDGGMSTLRMWLNTKGAEL
jgi:hypothetical protein